MDDKELVKFFLDGSDEAFESLVKKYLHPVFNFLYQLVRDKTVADDLAQETFVKAWKNIKKYDSDKSFKTWLFQIAKNTAYDYFKKKKTIPFVQFLDEEGNNKLENIADDKQQLEELLEKADATKQLEKKLQLIPEQYQLILTLHYKEDFSLQEIAEILKLPYNTIKSQHARALANLRKILL